MKYLNEVFKLEMTQGSFSFHMWIFILFKKKKDKIFGQNT